MDETNKRINNMVVEGLEKAGLATDTKLSGSCCSLIHPLDKALKSSPCQLWVKCTCAYPGARVSLRQTENGLRTTTDANSASCCHDFGRRTGCVQRKGLRVQSWPGCFGIESRQKASSFVMLSSLTFNGEKLIVESIKRGSVYCLRITTAVTDKAYIQVAWGLSLSRPHTIYW